MGVEALSANSTGAQNTATGSGTLLSNTAGVGNTANGYQSLLSNADGLLNTAVGYQALLNNTHGNGNVGIGPAALASNTVGIENTAIGFNALTSNIDGSNNVGIGNNALGNSSGDFNVAVGTAALSSANTTGSNNVALGHFAGTGVTTANNVICIGENMSGDNISGSCYIGNIHGEPVDPATVMLVGVDATGKLGTQTSSRRFKHDIRPMNNSSEAILALKPVIFHYKSDAKDTPQFGLIAEDVAQVNPDLVVRDKNGDLLSVRYEAVNAMLLNEFLKEHRSLVEEQDKVQKLESALEAVNTRLKEQDAKIEKVSARNKLSRPLQVVETP